MLLIGSVTAQGALGMFEGFLHKQVSIKWIARVRLYDFSDVFFKIYGSHIRIFCFQTVGATG